MPGRTPPPPADRTAIARIAAHRRHHPDRPELVADDLRLIRTSNAERYLRRLLAEAPPLTAEQRDHLAGLLRPSTRDEAVA